jgi:protein TonB
MFFSAAGFCFLEGSPVPMLETISLPVITRSNEHPWLALVWVLCAHLAVFAALPPQSQPSPAEAIPEPITVSLLSVPQPTLEKPVLPATPIKKLEQPIKKPISKPIVPRLNSATLPTVPPLEKTSSPITETSAPNAEPETKVTNNKPVLSVTEGPADTQTYQSPSFNAAYLNNPAPSYPPLSRRLGEQGRVLLRVQVMEDGTAGSVELQTGSGSNRLDQAALEAVKRWRFIPAKRGEQPVSASVVVPVRFSIEG